MNKRNKILVGCLALLLVLSVGYALFSETITINGTATAKGDFEFETTCKPGDGLGVFSGTGGVGYGEESCTVSDNIVTLSTELKYPGSFRAYTVEMKNIGSIDAMIKYVDGYPHVGETWVIDSYLLKLYNKSDDSLYQTYDMMGDDYPNDYVTIEPGYIVIKKEDGTILLNEEDVVSEGRAYKDASGNNYLRLLPGESFVTILSVQWPSAAEQTDYYAENILSYKTIINQFRNDLELDPNFKWAVDGE